MERVSASSGTKRCRACGETKARHLFYARKKSRDGLYNACKQCHNSGAKVPLPTLRERLGESIDSSGDGCHEWTGRTDRDGYGVIVVGKLPNGKPKRKGAHRALFELEHGELSSDVVVMHTCDNPPCCRLDHLTTGDNWDNTQDSVRKGRRATGERNGMYTHPERRVSHKGSANGMAKLSEDQVEEIRVLLGQKVRQKDIAVRFGISQPLVSMISTGRVRA